MYRREGIIVAIDTDTGIRGFGEIAPLPGFSAESLEDSLDRARECIRSIMRRQHIEASLPPALRERESIPPSVRAGIEFALLDLSARYRGTSHAGVFCDTPANSIRVNALLAGAPASVLDEAQSAAAKGYAAVKLKVGRHPLEADISTTRELRRALGDTIEIRLDANRAWTFDTALDFAHATADCRIAYIEEPIADPMRLSEFASRSPIPVAVDETLQDVGCQRLHHWRQAGHLEPFADIPADAGPLLLAILAARAWIVKPTLTGIPLTYIAHLLMRIRQIDADLVISSSFESGFALIALANLAACAGADAIIAGLDTASWFAADLIDAPLPLRDGTIDLTQANEIARRFSPEDLELLSDD